MSGPLPVVLDSELPFKRLVGGAESGRESFESRFEERCAGNLVPSLELEGSDIEFMSESESESEAGRAAVFSETCALCNELDSLTLWRTRVKKDHVR